MQYDVAAEKLWILEDKSQLIQWDHAVWNSTNCSTKPDYDFQSSWRPASDCASNFFHSAVNFVVLGNHWWCWAPQSDQKTGTVFTHCLPYPYALGANVTISISFLFYRQPPLPDQRTKLKLYILSDSHCSQWSTLCSTDNKSLLWVYGNIPSGLLGYVAYMFSA